MKLKFSPFYIKKDTRPFFLNLSFKKMINVLKSIKPVIKDLKKVSISQESINSLVSTISKEDLKISEIALAGFSWNLDQLIKIVFTFNTINFCFWAEEGKPKWTINTNGQKLDGATALFRTLENNTRKDEYKMGWFYSRC